jgi:hypothetical protein
VNQGSDGYFSDRELVVTIHSIVKMILGKRLIPCDPRSIEIVRVERPSVFPCRKSYGPDQLDISQLDWAAEKGSFWFLGPIKSLNVILDGSIKGKLELGVNSVLTFNTHFNALNFNDFTAKARKIEEMAKELGIKTYFEGDPSKYQDIKLCLSTEKSLSEHNVRDFIDKVQKIILTNLYRIERE